MMFEGEKYKVLSMGCSFVQANKVFILPTPPKGDYLIDNHGHLDRPIVADIIAQDGNHWRKILTILAKLSADQKDWREYRDAWLLQQDECILFRVPESFEENKLYFVCGGQMQSNVQEDRAFVLVDEKGLLKGDRNLIFCPYPDYRQFPNKLIDLNLAYLNQVSENKKAEIPC